MKRFKKMREKVMSRSQRRGKEGRKEGREGKRSRNGQDGNSLPQTENRIRESDGATGVQNKHSLVAIQKKHRRSGAFSETVHPQRHTSGVAHSGLHKSWWLNSELQAQPTHQGSFQRLKRKALLVMAILHPSLASISSTESFDHRHKGRMELQRKPHRQNCAAIRCLVGKMPVRAVEGFKKTDLRSAECDELMKGVWLEPIQAMLQRRTNKTWTEKHQHVTRKLVVEGLGAEKSVRHWLVR